jgi:choline dehydrogenase-like flavoprotein
LFVDESGATRQIQADIVVLAAHAIGTARLLLKSADNAWPDGLANSSGVVGQNLMMHPMNRMVGFFDEPMSSWQGHWGQSIYSMEFAESRPEHDFVRGAKWNLSPTGGPLNAALYPIDGPQPVGKVLHDRVDKWLGRSALWGMVAEDMPDSRNFLALDPAHPDADGDGLPRLHYTTTENSKRLLSFMAKRARESFSEAGAYEVAEQTLAAEIGWHPLGTCRMGNDPRSSVVDKWNRCHDISNLLIVDGSSFVTSSCVNPAATISAIAARATDHLINFRSEY